MKIVNKIKFIRTISILFTILLAILIFSNKSYSKIDVEYSEKYIYSGDTLWSIAKYQVENNKYFENKDIREVVMELKTLNNLKDCNLKVGQKISVPTYK